MSESVDKNEDKLTSPDDSWEEWFRQYHSKKVCADVMPLFIDKLSSRHSVSKRLVYEYQEQVNKPSKLKGEKNCRKIWT